VLARTDVAKALLSSQSRAERLEAGCVPSRGRGSTPRQRGPSLYAPALGALPPFGEAEKEDEGRPGAPFHRDAKRWLMAEDNLRSMGNEQALTVVRSPRPLHRSGKSLYFAHPLWIPHNGRMVRSVLMRVGPARDPLFFVTRARRRRHARNRAGISCVVLMKQQPPARSAH
jgi:hypothetical protein